MIFSKKYETEIYVNTYVARPLGIMAEPACKSLECSEDFMSPKKACRERYSKRLRNAS